MTGRQFVISGNRISLLYPAAYRSTDEEDVDGLWNADEIGQKIRESIKDWPDPATVPHLIF